jgi:hypothetical protein
MQRRQRARPHVRVVGGDDGEPADRHRERLKRSVGNESGAGDEQDGGGQPGSRRFGVPPDQRCGRCEHSGHDAERNGLNSPGSERRARDAEGQKPGARLCGTGGWMASFQEARNHTASASLLRVSWTHGELLWEQSDPFGFITEVMNRCYM